MKNNLPAWGVALAVCAPLLATAHAAKPEPPNATTQLTYRSAFADYKPFKEAPPANWRELNDSLAGAPGETSGHAGHGMGGMKGMGMPATPAAPLNAPMGSKPMPTHDGHPKTGGKP